MSSDKEYDVEEINNLLNYIEQEFRLVKYVFNHAKYNPNMGDKTYTIIWNGKQYSAQYTYDLVSQIKKAEGI